MRTSSHRLASEISEERERPGDRLASQTTEEREARLQQMSIHQQDRLVSEITEEREARP